MRPPVALPLLALVLLLSLVPAPPAAGYHAATACNAAQAEHTYGPVAAVNPGAGAVGVGGTLARDACLDLPAGDGDWDTSETGGLFPAGTSASCYPHPATVAHHGYGPGAEYRVADLVWQTTVVFAVGVDGPLPDPKPCAGDGIISDDPALAPLDCGSGQVGYVVESIYQRPATLGPNTPAATCDPVDGFVVAFIANVALSHPVMGPLVSRPVLGHVWG